MNTAHPITITDLELIRPGTPPPGTARPASKRIALCLVPDHWQELGRLGREQGRSAAALARVAVLEYLERHAGQ